MNSNETSRPTTPQENFMHDNQVQAVSSYIDFHGRTKRPVLILISDQDCPNYPTEDHPADSEGSIRIVQLRYRPGTERLAAMVDKWEHKDDSKRRLAVPDEDFPGQGPYIPIRMCKAPISKGTIIVY